MRAVTARDPVDGPVFPSTAVIRTVVHAAAATDKPIRVVDDGRLVGVVDRSQILEAVAGEPASPGSASAGEAESVPYRRPPVRVEPVNDPTQETAEFLVENLADRSAGDRNP